MIAVILFSTLLLSATPAVYAESFNVEDGAYELTEGLFTLKVTVESKKITSIEVLEHRGKDRYLEKVQPLIAQIIKEQTFDVDGFTGATLSSTDLIKALKQLLVSQ